MKFMRVLALLAFVVGGSTVMAQEEGPQVRHIGSWQELKDICQHPERINLQRPPAQVAATCVLTRQAIRTNGVVDELSFPSLDSINFESTSDKNIILELGREIDGPTQVMECPRIESVEDVYSLSFATTCQEVVEFEGDFGDFCWQKMQADTEDLERYKVSSEVIPDSERSLCNF